MELLRIGQGVDLLAAGQRVGQGADLIVVGHSGYGPNRSWQEPGPTYSGSGCGPTCNGPACGACPCGGPSAAAPSSLVPIANYSAYLAGVNSLSLAIAVRFSTEPVVLFTSNEDIGVLSLLWSLLTFVFELT
jgi:hypothetical protein